MAERKEQKKAPAVPPVRLPSEAARYRMVTALRGESELSHVLDLYQDVARKLLGFSFYGTPAGEERAKEDPVFSFVSYRSDEKEFRAWLIKKYGPITDDVPEVGQWLSEIDRSIERMRRDQEEIDRLKEETRAAIARLQAA
jgi:hypothetical protein